MLSKNPPAVLLLSLWQLQGCDIGYWGRFPHWKGGQAWKRLPREVGQSPSLGVLKHKQLGHFVMWFTWPKVGLDELGGVFQPQGLHDSVIPSQAATEWTHAGLKKLKNPKNQHKQPSQPTQPAKSQHWELGVQHSSSISTDICPRNDITIKRDRSSAFFPL